MTAVNPAISQAEAWKRVFDLCTKLDPDLLKVPGHEDRSAVEIVMDFIRRNHSSSRTPRTKEIVLDKNASWKLTGAHLEVVISYLNSFPKDAYITVEGTDANTLQIKRAILDN
jgi:hypothetical protein